MSVYFKGKEVAHTGFRNVNTEDEVMDMLDKYPKLIKSLDRLVEMKDDLISRKSLADYIEEQIEKCESTEMLCCLRALSVQVAEFEPAAYDSERVMKKLDEKSQLIRPVGWANPQEVILTKDVMRIVKDGGVNE